MRAIQARERLHRLDARELLVDVHRVQQRLVVVGLELVGADQEAVRVLLNLVGDLARRKAVERRLGHLGAAVLMLAGEGDDRPVAALALGQIVAKGVEVLDRALDAAGHHHCARLAADQVPRQHLFVEVVDHDLGLEPDGVVVAFDVATQLLLRPPGVELRVALDLPDELVVAVDWRVVLEHVQDEALLDRLLHRVAVERPVLHRAVGLRLGLAEDLERPVLRRGGEGEVAGVGQQLLGLHQPVDPVLQRLVVVLGAGRGKRHRHRRRRAPALTRMRLVDDDGEAAPAVLGPDLVQDERKLLHRGDDDLLALGEKQAQVARVLRVPHRGAHLRELLDGVADLLVEDAPVGDDDDRVEDWSLGLRKADELVRKPGNRVRLAAARRVLDQIAPARAAHLRVGEQPAQHVELVIARPDLEPLLPAGLVVPGLDDLRVVLEDVGQARAGEHALPQVVGLQPVGVGRVAGAVAPALVERQEPRALAVQVRTEAHLVVVHRKVHHAAPELEQPLARVAVALVLLDGVFDRLLGQAVLQLEGGDGQTVDEQRHVQRALGLVTAVAQLPRDAVAVGGIALGRLGVARRRRAVEDVDVVRPVLEPVAQHVDGAAPGCFALKAREELAPRRPVLAEVERLAHLRLRLVQEGRELREVHTVFAVVVLCRAADPARGVGRRALLHPVGWHAWVARCAGQRRADQALQAALGGVGSTHAGTRSASGCVHPLFASTSTAMPIWRGVNCRLRSFQA